MAAALAAAIAADFGRNPIQPESCPDPAGPGPDSDRESRGFRSNHGRKLTAVRLDPDAGWTAAGFRLDRGRRRCAEDEQEETRAGAQAGARARIFYCAFPHLDDGSNIARLRDGRWDMRRAWTLNEPTRILNPILSMNIKKRFIELNAKFIYKSWISPSHLKYNLGLLCLQQNCCRCLECFLCPIT